MSPESRMGAGIDQQGEPWTLGVVNREPQGRGKPGTTGRGKPGRPDSNEAGESTRDI